MSWSISLYGRKEVVMRELFDAAAVLQQAIDSTRRTVNTSQDSLTVNVSGYVSWDNIGVVSGSTQHSVSVSRSAPKIESPVSTVVSADDSGEAAAG